MNATARGDRTRRDCSVPQRDALPDALAPGPADLRPAGQVAISLGYAAGGNSSLKPVERFLRTTTCRRRSTRFAQAIIDRSVNPPRPYRLIGRMMARTIRRAMQIVAGELAVTTSDIFVEDPTRLMRVRGRAPATRVDFSSGLADLVRTCPAHLLGDAQPRTTSWRPSSQSCARRRVCGRCTRCKARRAVAHDSRVGASPRCLVLHDSPVYRGRALADGRCAEIERLHATASVPAAVHRCWPQVTRGSGAPSQTAPALSSICGTTRGEGLWRRALRGRCEVSRSTYAPRLGLQQGQRARGSGFLVVSRDDVAPRWRADIRDDKLIRKFATAGRHRRDR